MSTCESKAPREKKVGGKEWHQRKANRCPELPLGVFPVPFQSSHFLTIMSSFLKAM